METVITVLHVLVCLFLIIVVLLQPGKGGDVAAAFGGGSSQSVFGSRGATTFLQKLTSAVAALFMVTTVTLAYFASEGTRGGSVIDTDALEEAQQKGDQPAIPVTTPESTSGAAGVPAPADAVPAAAPAEAPADSAPAAAAPAAAPAAPVPAPAAPAESGAAPAGSGQ